MVPGEARWFAFYAPLAFAYRLFVMFSIAIFISTQYFVIGVVIALWTLAMTLGLPIYRALGWLGAALAGQHSGNRGRRVGLALVFSLVILFFVIPMPYHTQVDGVLWLPESGVLRAGQSGFVQKVSRAPGSNVEPGDEILTLHNLGLETALIEQAARADVAQVRYESQVVSDPVQAGPLKTELEREQNALRALQERASRLELHGASAGRLWLFGTDDLPGRFFKQGEVVGYIVPPRAPTVLAIVDQADEELIRGHGTDALLRLSSAPDTTWHARVVRAVPAASRDLPSSALGRHGGGEVAIDPRDESGRKALTSHFQYELALPEDFPYRIIGNRVSIRFEHAPEVLGERLGRSLRRLFLAYFHT
jgi:putative peptide zinc metalloprotease protein